MKYRFLHFELDTERFELLRRGEKLLIQPQALAILGILVRNHGKLVRKEELVRQLWNNRSISDSALSSQIKALRRILGDSGHEQHVIRTVYGRGFRFVTRVETHALKVGQDIAQSRPLVSDALTEKAGKPPVVAVLPLCKIGKMNEHAGLSEALPADITTALSQLRWLFVIARASSFRFEANLPDLEKMRRELDVDYVLTGWIELIGRQMLVGVELTETRQHRVVWAERYEAPLADIHVMRAQMVRDIITAIDLSISDTEASYAKLRAPDQLTGWEAYHLGMSSVNGAKMDLKQALDHFEFARAQAPTFARAHAATAYIHGLGLFHLARGGDQDAAIRNMLTSGEQALRCDPLDPFAHLVNGRAERVSGNIDSALDHYEKAISFCPNYAEAYNSQAVSLMLKGDFSAAYKSAKLAIKLSPNCPMRFEAETTQTYAAFNLGLEEEALSLSRRLAQFSQHSPLALIAAMTVFHHLGSESEARRIQARILSTGIEPRINVLRTFPDSAAEISDQITRAFTHYFGSDQDHSSVRIER
ncbi:winged helix-turn-helix domain-containing protein [uncultured Parasphingorhabdus sp.]|uniref:winged helix-turn-helix domain-containing protein n=1 Tax=uncultured Parasphingorhabdus sp. TaxID=2709694 RepID=UPI002AA8472E|nr:winged helix-turn-helix domain-containing protein [uncultured Parasphingorhabdus sp.]